MGYCRACNERSGRTEAGSYQSDTERFITVTHGKETSEYRKILAPARQALLEQQSQAALPSDTRPQAIRQRPNLASLPLSFSQERMWFLDQWQPESPAHKRHVGLRLAGELDVPALERTLGEIIRRHEVLRATFPGRDGQVVQIIAPAQPVSLPLVQVPGPSPEARELEARRLASFEIQRPLDLAHGPLFRAMLLRLDDEDHVLVVVIHQVAFDSWSAWVLQHEMTMIYDAFSAGQSSPLAEPPIQYVDYAAWQRDSLQTELFQTQLAYWQRQLQGAPPLLELPTDHPRPPVQTHRAAHVTLLLPDDLTRALAALGERDGATLFMTLLAGFKVLLYRLTGQPDVVVGAPVANRGLPETKSLIGPFSNNLVLRSDLSDDPTFLHLLHHVRETVLAAYDHQDIPFELLLDELRPQRDPSRAPFFQIYFDMHAVEGPGLASSRLRVEPFELETLGSNHDLALLAAEQGGSLRVAFVYNTDLFEAATIARWASHYRMLLEGIALAPETPIRDLPLLTAADRHQLLVKWNDTQIEYPRNGCIQHLFESQAERTPDAIAVQFEDRVLSYRELNARANQVAHYLQRHLVNPDGVVGISIERSPEMVIGVLGILKAGGAFLPLDLSLPKERLAFMMQDAGITLLLTEERQLPALPEHQARVICIDTEWEAIAAESEENPAGWVSAENLAYVLYTSGSTGIPKGIAMHHRPLCNLVVWLLQESRLPAGARMLQFSPLSFALSLFEMFWSWASGGTLVLITDELRHDAAGLLDFLSVRSVERVYLPVTALQQLAEVSSSTGIRPGSLGEIVTAGEQLLITPPIAELLRALPTCTLHNQYGSTETHVVSGFTLEGSPNDWPTLPPIGRPIANVQIYLLDGNMQPVPVAIAGELYVGGDSLARGYLHRPGLTAGRFVPNPFAGAPGMRLYRTGDLARYLPDGNIEFLGRSDRQVKIGGSRVELGELEAILAQHPAVQHVAVQTKVGTQGDERLVAYVVPAGEQGIASGDLRDYLRRKLPDYMVPAAFVLLDSFPLTPSGKVNLRALPDPDWSKRELEDVYVAPRTPAEEKLATIWVQILGVKEVGVHDNFFELGGHSLSATRLVNRITDTFQVRIPLRSLFEMPTIAGLARAIEILRKACQDPGFADDGTSGRRVEGEL